MRQHISIAVTPPKQDRPLTWRDRLPVHPAADLFPMMSRDELLALGEDIKANGLRSRITLWSLQGHPEKDWPIRLLDGRNRLAALEAVGYRIDFTNFNSQLKAIAHKDAVKSIPIAFEVHLDGDPYAVVISANLHRRHLTSEQKRELIATLVKASPETSDRQIAKQVKSDGKTVGKVRAKLESRAEIPHVKTKTDTKGRKQPARKKQASEKPAGALIGSRPTPDMGVKSESEKAFAEFKFAVKTWWPKMNEKHHTKVLEFIIIHEILSKMNYRERFDAMNDFAKRIEKQFPELEVRISQSMSTIKIGGAP